MLNGGAYFVVFTMLGAESERQRFYLYSYKGVFGLSDVRRERELDIVLFLDC